MTKSQVFGCPKNKIRLLVLPCWYQIILESAYCVLLSITLFLSFRVVSGYPYPIHQQSTLAPSSAMVKGTWKWLCDASGDDISLSNGVSQLHRRLLCYTMIWA